ncbi:MAG: GMC oxidoreductase [Gemmatimonadaceae bacterium]
MHLDAKRFSSGTTLDTDVCIVGAGPAGLVLAAELAGGRHDVILLESGGDQPEPDLQALNDGDLIGDEYASLGASRHRQVGGTSHLWNTPVAGMAGAKYVPLDAADFERRGGRGLAGWPFGLTELRGDYERAQRMCGLGPFAYDAAAWAEPKCEPWADAGALVSRVYQVGTREALVAPLRRVIDAATNVRLCSHATAVALDRDTQGRRVNRVSIATLGAAPWSVRAARVVLAAGAVENARLLLLTDDRAGCAGNASGWVGRGFMEHPRDSGIVLQPRSRDVYDASAFYDLHRAADGTWIIGRLAVGDVALRDGDMPNASATLLARPRPVFAALRAALPAAGRRFLPAGGHGWSSRTHPARLYDGFTVLLNIEQPPHADNRVTLGTRPDALGVPLPALEWRWRPDDQRGLDRLRTNVVASLGAVGKVTVDAARPPDPNAHHHAGTTRMHDDPALGVTDRNARVHGMDNLYVAGTSLFPTAGFANPTLTIVALTLRLARHLLAEG